MIKPDTLLTSHQTSSLLQVNPSSVRTWIDQGHLVAFRTPGGHRRIRAADLVAFLRAHAIPIPRDLASADRRRLLMVDDDSRLLAAWRRVLNAHTAQVDFRLVDNGIEGLVHVGAFQPHLVVLDVYMPGLDGIEVCRRLKSSSLTADADVVLISGSASGSIEDEALAAGARRFITKPLDLTEVLEELGILVRHPQAPRL